MSAWLRNLQGQLTELASEVLSEATQEVQDPESELQVTKKKLEEAEAQLLAERSNSEMLQNKLVDLKEQLYLKNLDVDTIVKKYTGMVESRDSEIRSLQVELQRLQQGETVPERFGEADEEEFLSDSSVTITRLRLRNEELSKEVQHWKRIANDSGNQNYPQKVVALERKLSEMKQKSEAEMAALIQAHRENTDSLKAEYEAKLQSPGASTGDHLEGQSEEKTSVEGWDEGNAIDEEVSEEEEEALRRNRQVHNIAFQDAVQGFEKKLRDVEAECDSVRKMCSERSAALAKKESEIGELRSELEQAHSLIDIQREKFERELSLEKETYSKLLAEADEKTDNAEQALKCSEERFGVQDHELEKLKRENKELTAAYNDLNEEFENHRAEHGSVVTSNRDLTMRIDALKANLIEYEEKYELCKAENAETAKQLEKLTNDFENLRVSFESTRESSSFDSVAELERLRTELEIVKRDRERLRSDVDRFTQSVRSIDTELNKLRNANKKLEHDNQALASNLDMFMDIRDTLEKRDQELKKLYAEILQLQEENSQNDVTRQALAEVTQEKEKLYKELEECRMLLTEQETSVRRYRAIVGNQAADIVEMKNVEGKSSSEGTSDSNNEWVKTGDWDASTSTATQHHLIEELKEALAMVTEKTDECDELRRQKGELEKELDLRQNCIDELMAQTNSLQAQQQIQAESFNEVRDWLKDSDRKKLDAERALVRLKEEFYETISFLDIQLQRLKDFLERLKEMTAAAADPSLMNALISELESVCTELSDKKVKQQQYLDDMTLSLTTEEAMQMRDLFEKINEEHKSTLESLRHEYEDNLKKRDEEVAPLTKRLAVAEQKSLELVEISQALEREVQQLKQVKDTLTARLSEVAEECALKTKESDLGTHQFEEALKEREKQSTLYAEENVRIAELLKEREKQCNTYAEENARIVEALNEREKQCNTYAEENARILEALNEREKQCNEYGAEKARVLEALNECERQCNLYADANAKIMNDLQQKEASLAETERVRGELISLVEQKHTESVNYHSQLQNLAGEKELIQNELRTVMQKLAGVEDQLLHANEGKDRAVKECERLRQHLLTMEESFTRDAVAAEERETELRSRVRELELRTEESADTVISSTNAYQRQMEELFSEMDLIKSERDNTKEELHEKTRLLEDTKKALSNLQKVLRDIGVDHETQISGYESQISALKTNVNKLEKEVSNLYASEESLLAEKDDLIMSEKALKEELVKKDSVIDELETQMDERMHAASSSSASTYRIDDETLRQLFLSYFTADSSKKPEIAVLLSSILGYTAEDAAKIQAANPTGSRGWFGFGGPQRPAQQAPSITEQFIRFLERESLGPSASHSLPLQTSKDKSTIRSSQLPSSGSRFSDTGDLRSILDS